MKIRFYVEFHGGFKALLIKTTKKKVIAMRYSFITLANALLLCLAVAQTHAMDNPCAGVPQHVPLVPWADMPAAPIAAVQRPVREGRHPRIHVPPDGRPIRRDNLLTALNGPHPALGDFGLTIDVADLSRPLEDQTTSPFHSMAHGVQILVANAAPEVTPMRPINDVIRQALPEVAQLIRRAQGQVEPHAAPEANPAQPEHDGIHHLLPEVAQLIRRAWGQDEHHAAPGVDIEAAFRRYRNLLLDSDVQDMLRRNTPLLLSIARDALAKFKAMDRFPIQCHRYVNEIMCIMHNIVAKQLEHTTHEEDRSREERDRGTTTAGTAPVAPVPIDHNEALGIRLVQALRENARSGIQSADVQEDDLVLCFPPEKALALILELLKKRRETLIRDTSALSETFSRAFGRLAHFEHSQSPLRVPAGEIANYVMGIAREAVARKLLNPLVFIELCDKAAKRREEAKKRD